MRIVLDTSALYYPRALRKLPRTATIVVPAVVLVERARQLKRDGRATPTEALMEFIDAGYEIEALGAREALLAAHRAPEDAGAWRDSARDAMIAAHVRDDDVLWTANGSDFARLGIPRRQIRDPAAVR